MQVDPKIMGIIMNRRNFMKKGAFGAAAATLAGKGTISRAASRRPNIVLIVSDDHGTDALGCWGNKVMKTPALESCPRAGIPVRRGPDEIVDMAECYPPGQSVLWQAFCRSAAPSPSVRVVRSRA